jgi:hypothetical protein
MSEPRLSARAAAFLTCAVIAAANPGSAAAVDAARIPVVVRGTPEDRLTRLFVSAVTREFDKDPRFVSAKPGTPGTIGVLLPSRVGWERANDWTRVTYQARLNSADGRTHVISGACWNWNLRACAQQITAAAAQAGRSAADRSAAVRH